MIKKSWAEMGRQELRDRERVLGEVILENKLCALYADLESALVEALENGDQPSAFLVENVHAWSNDLYQNGITDTPTWKESQELVNIAGQLYDSSSPCNCPFSYTNPTHSADCPVNDEENPYYD